MNADQKNLFDLLPAIHRIRDEKGGGPMQELLDVIAGQVAVLEEDLEQFYDDQFIETCAEWVVPYIGDLIGYRSLYRLESGIGRARAEVANTISYRRHKGTVAMLEQLAHDVTGWPARVVEFFQLLVTTQFMNHIRLNNALTTDVRGWRQLESLDGPFDVMAHSVDTRSIITGEGRHNIQNVGIFLWRLGAYRLSRSPAVGLDSKRWLLSPTANNSRLFTRPQTELSVTQRAGYLNVPAPISRRRMSEFCEDYYGDGKSVFIEGVAIDKITICDLSDVAGGWAHTPPTAGKVLIDPVLGRIAFGDPQALPPLVTFHYGFSTDMGGGEYERAATFELPSLPVQGVTSPASVQTAINARVSGQAIQIEDNGRYAETLTLAVKPGERFELRGANGRRPTIVLGGEMLITGGDDQAEVTLNGLLLIGARIRVTGTLRYLRLKHCTLVPGLSLDTNGIPQKPDEPSLIVETGGLTIKVDHSIIGGIRWHELSRVEIKDSIVDATDSAGVALAGPGAVPPGSVAPMGGTMRMEESTVFGKVHVLVMELISNSIISAKTKSGDGWVAPVLVERKQVGCCRFSFLSDGARTPRRYKCQPDLEIAIRTEAAEKEARGKNQTLTDAERAAIRIEVVSWLKPSFTALRYGEAAYAQLRSRSPKHIYEGADDESAMGAFHDLFEPQRRTNLRIRLDEYLRFSLEAGIFTVT